MFTVSSKDWESGPSSDHEGGDALLKVEGGIDLGDVSSATASR
jgi:hypothetical protein